ncbi:hypothetical protein ACFOYW_08335 [Gryllotalpicola reticulitermitis]|uniref:Uncharacterized protein n=1 Tax=Gryllotalpicola reticulitermitis TaxID=1184153 RepID=A0ABV8Q6F8_9MICO
MARGVNIGPFSVSNGATRGKQNKQVRLQKKQLKTAKAQLEVTNSQLAHDKAAAEAQTAQALAAEKAAHDRWYFALPAPKQAEYDAQQAATETQEAYRAVEEKSQSIAAVRLLDEKRSALKFKKTMTIIAGIAALISIPLIFAGGFGVATLIIALIGIPVTWWWAPRARTLRIERMVGEYDALTATAEAAEARSAQLAARAAQAAASGS